MTNNILKEVKNELISKGKEPNIDNFDQYISQNKLFSILFFSKIIPNYTSILTNISTIFSKFDSIKLILCICEDTKEDFDEVLLSIKDISCLIFNFESKSRHNFILSYNIISLPCLIILNKDGILLDSLTCERINNLKNYDLKGWENKFIVPNLYKLKKLEIGDVVKLSCHAHELVYSNQQMKPGYGNSGWICDMCRASHKSYTTNFFCIICGWDICDKCYNKYKNE